MGLLRRRSPLNFHTSRRLLCDDLAGSVHDLTEAITQRLAAEGPSVEVARQRVERATFALLRAAGRVQLVGTPAIRNASVWLAQFVNVETQPLRGVPITGPPKSFSLAEEIELATINEGLNQRYDEFVDAARRDIGSSSEEDSDNT